MKFIASFEFDLVLALAIHPSDWGGFESLADRILRPSLRTGGRLVFEERKFKRHIDFQRYIDYFMNIEFGELYRGMCQCSADNHLRNFIVLEKL